MKKAATGLAMLSVLLCGAVASHASSGLGAYWAYMRGDDIERGYGFGVKWAVETGANARFEFRAANLRDFHVTEAENTDLKIVPLEAAMVMDFTRGSGGSSFYWGGGLGYYILRSFVLDDVRYDYDDEYGYFALGGMRLQLSKSFSFFAETQYNWLEIEKARIDRVKRRLENDMSLTGPVFHVGLLFHW